MASRSRRWSGTGGHISLAADGSTNAPQFSVRKATANDAGALARCRADLFRELHNDPLAVTSGFEPACESMFEACFAVDTCAAWIAEAPNEPGPIGNLVLLKFPRLPTPANLAISEGYILNVFVTHAWRNRGVASALVGSAIEYSQKSGFARIRLHTTPAGRNIYAEQGFVLRDNEMELVIVV